MKKAQKAPAIAKRPYKRRAAVVGGAAENTAFDITALPVFDGQLASRDETIRALMNSLNTEGKCVIAMASDVPNSYALRRPTGIAELDIDLGGGFPSGGCSFIAGPDNAGKSWLLFKTMAMQQKLYGDSCRLALGITEGGFAFDQAVGTGLHVRLPPEMIEQLQEGRRARGLPLYSLEELAPFQQKVGEVYVIRGTTGEEILNAMVECVRSKAFSVIGCDSMHGLQPTANADKEMTDHEVRAAHANMMGRFWKQYIPITTGLNGLNTTAVLFTQQVRANQERANAPAHMQKYLSAWEPAGGGWATAHYGLIRLVIHDGKTLKKGDQENRETIGKQMCWELYKGKAGTHDNKAGDAAYYYAEHGIDTTGELIVSGMKRNVIQQRGSKWVVVRPDTKEVLEGFTAPSQKALRKMIDADFDFELALRQEILTAAGVACLYR